jgi:hypothetical protein
VRKGDEDLDQPLYRDIQKRGWEGIGDNISRQEERDGGDVGAKRNNRKTRGKTTGSGSTF